MKNIFNLNSTSTGLNAFSRASKGDSQDARKGSTLTKMAAVICTFSCFQGGQNDKEGLKCKAKKVKRCKSTTSYFFLGGHKDWKMWTV